MASQICRARIRKGGLNQVVEPTVGAHDGDNQELVRNKATHWTNMQQ